MKLTNKDIKYMVNESVKRLMKEWYQEDSTGSWIMECGEDCAASYVYYLLEGPGGPEEVKTVDMAQEDIAFSIDMADLIPYIKKEPSYFIVRYIFTCTYARDNYWNQYTDDCSVRPIKALKDALDEHYLDCDYEVVACGANISEIDAKRLATEYTKSVSSMGEIFFDAMDVMEKDAYTSFDEREMKEYCKKYEPNI